MAKHNNSEFVKITVDGKVLPGASEEAQYKEWFEGHNPIGLQLYAGSDGPIFDVATLSLVASQGTGTLLETFLKRGHKNIIIETVCRSSDKFSDSYESSKIVYHDCNLHEVILTHDEEGVLYTRITFSPENKVEITLQVPDKVDGALAKVGPIVYSIPEKKLA